MQKRSIILSTILAAGVSGLIYMFVASHPQSENFSFFSKNGEKFVVSTLSASTNEQSHVLQTAKEGNLPKKEVTIFRTPDTSWRNRTIVHDGKSLVYEFGKGNPSEVALVDNDLGAYQQDPSNRGYMTPEAEIAMKQFLENPELTSFVQKCQSLIAAHSPKQTLGVVFPQSLDMEYVMYVDPKTGRKEFRDAEVLQAIEAVWWSINNPMADLNDRAWHQCLAPHDFDQVEDAMSMFFKALGYYLNPHEKQVVPVHPL